MGKRTHTDMENSQAPAASSPFLPMFEQFRAELDEHHDRRERIIKASRDITAASKKIIFTLQRTRRLNEPLPQNIAKGNEPYYKNIAAQFASVSNDLQGLNAHRYSRQITGGCQEWMEAVSFEHYLTTASLITFEDAAIKLRGLDQNGSGIALTIEDYLLGIFDMTGELMRFAITTMAMNGKLPEITSAPDTAESSSEDTRSILHDMRALRSALEALNARGGPLGKDVDKKMEVMRASVEKVERALYGLVVRGAERPQGWLPDTEPSRAVEVEG
ncbi:Putative Translin family [Septoria linicola]|uniref:Translin family n=1 Tax=Septoria linicola TaxID=215465 RepID=A0A9Q9AJ25_9PEZI|nr:putative Translin family [Septoria linicola]USW47365.1 Putative Translin family [Septoria linicola]